MKGLSEIGNAIVADAWAAFDKWCREHDPDGEMEWHEQVRKYGEWCDAGNRVELNEAR